MTGLYVHVPFCVSKCAYCDFYSLADQTDLVPAYIDAVLTEAQAHAGMSFDTLYLGGGTPSLLGAANLEKLIRGLKDDFDLSRLAEATIEVNPESASEGLLRSAIDLGFTACRSAFSRFRTASCGAWAGCTRQLRRWRPCPGWWGWGSEMSLLMSSWACRGKRWIVSLTLTMVLSPQGRGETLPPLVGGSWREGESTQGWRRVATQTLPDRLGTPWSNSPAWA